MTPQSPFEGRSTLVHGYRNLSERQIRARLEGPLSDAERVTAKAELLRRGDNGPDTTLAEGFAPTSLFDVESSSEPDLESPNAGGATHRRGWARLWPWIAILAVLGLLALAWALRGRFIHGS